MTKLFTALALVFSSCAAFGLTLGEKKEFNDAKKYIEESSDMHGPEFKEKCGYALPITLNESLVQPFMKNNSSIASYCDSPRSAMATMCEDATSKEAITKKIKKMTCKFGKGGADRAPSLKISGTELIVELNTDTANIENHVKKWLESNL